ARRGVRGAATGVRGRLGLVPPTAPRGRAPPLWSVTVPSIVPVVWAGTKGASKSRQAARTKVNRYPDFIPASLKNRETRCYRLAVRLEPAHLEQCHCQRRVFG